jgi:hypothetical protein
MQTYDIYGLFINPSGNSHRVKFYQRAKKKNPENLIHKVIHRKTEQTVSNFIAIL